MPTNGRMETAEVRNLTQSVAAGRFAAVLFIGLLATASAQARPVIVASIEDAANPGFFTLDFGMPGALSTGSITATEYELEVDPEAGTSKLVHYYQEVQPIILPGGFSTGNIVVELVEGSSTGRYDQTTRGFTTSEMYAVHFRADLSAFGLESPVILPSTSSGTVELNGLDGGRVDLEWAGEGELLNPFDPENTLQFSYTCVVNTVFAARADLLVRLGLTPDVRKLHLPWDLEKDLVSELRKVAIRIDQGFDSMAVRHLRAFTNIVADEAGQSIPRDDAENLIYDARETIALLRTGLSIGPR